MIRFALLALAAASILTAQTKLAFINSQAAVADTAEIKKAQAELEARYKSRQEEVEKLRKELADIENQLRTGEGKLNAQAQQNLQFQGQRRQRDLQRLTEDLQSDVNRDREQILQRVGSRMQEVVTKLAQQRQLDGVIDVSNTVYFRPDLDITKDATAAYDKAYPPPAAAAPAK
jgi:outer membrane protein